MDHVNNKTRSTRSSCAIVFLSFFLLASVTIGALGAAAGPRRVYPSRPTPARQGKATEDKETGQEPMGTSLAVVPPPLGLQDLMGVAVDYVRDAGEVALTPKKMRGLIADWTDHFALLPVVLTLICVSFAAVFLYRIGRASIRAIMG